MIAILLSYTVTSREVAKQIPFQSVMLTEKEKSSVHNGQIRYEHSIWVRATKKIFSEFM